MKARRVVSSYKEGTAYVESVGIPTKPEKRPEEPYTVVRNFSGDLYQFVKIEANKLSFAAMNSDNKLSILFPL